MRFQTGLTVERVTKFSEFAFGDLRVNTHEESTKFTELGSDTRYIIVRR